MSNCTGQPGSHTLPALGPQVLTREGLHKDLHGALQAGVEAERGSGRPQVSIPPCSTTLFIADGTAATASQQKKGVRQLLALHSELIELL